MSYELKTYYQAPSVFFFLVDNSIVGGGGDLNHGHLQRKYQEVLIGLHDS